MHTLEDKTTSYSLQRSLDDLHRESLAWLSDIRFWDTELNFFEKLLVRAGQMSRGRADMEEKDALQKQMMAFKEDAIDGFGVEVQAHERYLEGLVAGKGAFDDMTYRETHVPLGERLDAYEKRYRSFKMKLFGFVTTLA